MELVDSCVAESRNDLGRERPEGYGCDFKGTRRPRQGSPQHFLWDPCAYVFSLWFPTDVSKADLSLTAKNASYSSDAGGHSLFVTLTTSATCTSVISAFFSCYWQQEVLRSCCWTRSTMSGSCRRSAGSAFTATTASSSGTRSVPAQLLRLLLLKCSRAATCCPRRPALN